VLGGRSSEHVSSQRIPSGTKCTVLCFAEDWRSLVIRNERALAGLWEHQRAAVDVARSYLEARDVHGESALITMPTGTGKSGVIAAITTCLPKVRGHRLVLTPWDALVKQLIADLKGRFWERLDPDLRPNVMPVKRLPPSTDLDSLKDTEPTIYVATIAAISVANAARSDLDKIFAGFGCVLVDEGHYEPAANWSRAIRGLGPRTILLTATPYRNDRKFFEVGKWRYRFKHHDAQNSRYLRKPEFVMLAPSSGPDAFAAELVRAVSDRFLNDPQDVRVIVRCETSDAVRDMVFALRAIGESVIGVHDTFNSGDPDLRRAVPSTDDCDARFWVHQNKLIEGIDDPRFKVLAFYDSLKNGRAIVQQIGRVLRNPQRRTGDMKALVVSRGDGNIEHSWKNYRSFDLQDDADSAATLPNLLDVILKEQVIYYDGAYRRPVDLFKPKLWEDFAFPLRTRVFKSIGGAAASLDDLQEKVLEAHEQRDRVVYLATESPDASTRIMAVVQAENSKYLRDAIFIEPRFGYTVFRLRDDLLFFYDTAGSTPDVITDHFRPLRPPELHVLFPSGRTELTSIALLNTDLGRQAPRSRQFRASAIADLAPDLADYAYVCTIAEGYTEVQQHRFRRYLGISRSRISDFQSGEKDFDAYSEWLDTLHHDLTNPSTATDVFTRYATYVDEPDVKDPEHIMLDIDPTNFAKQRPDTPLEIEDRAVSINRKGEFSLIVNGMPYTLKVIWNRKRKRYEVVSPSLQSERFLAVRGDGVELLSVINAEQLLRLVPRERTTIYAHGSFYKPIIPATRPGSFRLLDVLYAVDVLEQTRSEKGSAIENDDWQHDCVFGLISALAPQNPRTPPTEMGAFAGSADLIFCTDLGTEVADFVITEPHRVAFVHAKASKDTHRCSASALHDVASQAIKNLPHLQPLSVAPMDRNLWAKPWSAPSHVQGETNRLRHGSFGSGEKASEEIWSHLRSRIQAPDTEREVWLVLGNALSKGELTTQAAKRKPTAEAIQVFSLLQTTWGAVSQLGGRLRIFCSP
jgi:superfamily II DNA or RNA helicase